MKLVVLALTLLVAAAPRPAAAIVLDDASAQQTCRAEPGSLVVMPCTQQPPQLQTLRTSLIRTLVPMNCRPTGVRFRIAGLPLAPGRAAGLIATAIFHAPTKTTHLEQMCQPTGW